MKQRHLAFLVVMPTVVTVLLLLAGFLGTNHNNDENSLRDKASNVSGQPTAAPALRAVDDGDKVSSPFPLDYPPLLRTPDMDQRTLQIQLPGPVGGVGQPRPTDPPIELTAPPFTSMSYFILEYGFEAGTQRDPTVEEVDAMLCFTRDFIFDRVTAELAAQGDTKPILVRAWSINWNYNTTADLPVEVTFHVDIRYTDDSDFVAKETIFTAFTLTNDDVAAYIRDYVWNVDVNNVFYYAIQVDYRLRGLEPEPASYRLERSACEYTRPPTTAPLPGSTGSTTPPATPPPANNPSATSPPANNPSATTPPANNPPATNVPATSPPANNPPATNSPATSPPANNPPASNPPATSPPATNPPDTSAPDTPGTTPEPGTAAPATDTPVSNPPASTPAPNPGGGIGGGGGGVPIGGIGIPSSTEAPETTTPLEPGSATDAPGETPVPDNPVEEPNPPDSNPNENNPGTTTTTAPATTPVPTTAPPTTPNPTVTPGAPSAQPTPAPTAPPVQESTSAVPLVPVSFRMEFTWREPDYVEREPTLEEVNDAMCHTNVFLVNRLKVAINQEIVVTDISNVSWRHTVSGSDEKVVGKLQVDMTLTAAYGGLLDLIPPNVVIAAVEDSKSDLLEFLLNRDGTSNIFANREDHLFQHFSHLEMDDYPLNTELAAGQIAAVADCPENMQPPDPKLLGEPLDSNEIPNIPPPPEENNDSGELGRPSEAAGEDTTTLAPGETLAPTTPPAPGSTLPPGATPSPGSGPGIPTETGSGIPSQPVVESGSKQITVSFIVSNLDYITIPAEVNRSGLSQAFPDFIEALVERVSTEPVQRRFLRRKLQGIQLEQDSAYVAQIIRTDCGKSAHTDLVCHEALAQFDLAVVDDGDPANNPPTNWENKFTLETYKALHDGTFYEIMKERVPDTPLFIGTVLPGEENASSFTKEPLFWVLVIIAALLAILVCCLCIFLFLQKKKHDEIMKERDDGGGRRPLHPRNHHHHHNPPSRTTDDTTPESNPLLAINEGNHHDDDSSDEEEFESDMFQTKDDGPNITEDSFVDDYTDDFLDEAAYGVLDDQEEQTEKTKADSFRNKDVPVDVFQDEPIANEHASNGVLEERKAAPEAAPTSPIDDDDDDDASIVSSSSSSSSESSSSSSSNSSHSSKSSEDSGENKEKDGPASNPDLEDSVQLEDIFNLSRPLDSTIEYRKKQRERERAKELTPMPTMEEESVGSHDTRRSAEDEIEDVEPTPKLEIEYPSPPVLLDVKTSDVENDDDANAPVQTFNETVGGDSNKYGSSRSADKWAGGLPTADETAESTEGTNTGGSTEERNATRDTAPDEQFSIESPEKNAVPAVLPKVASEKIASAMLKFQQALDLQKVANQSEKEKQDTQNKVLGAMHSGTGTSEDYQARSTKRGSPQDDADSDDKYNKYNNSDEAVAWDDVNEPRRSRYNDSEGAVAWDDIDENSKSYNYNDSSDAVAWDQNDRPAIRAFATAAEPMNGIGKVESSDLSDQPTNGEKGTYNSGDGSEPWKNYDETVKGLRSIGSSHHNREEVISFDDSDDDDSDDEVEWEDCDDVMKVVDPAAKFRIDDSGGNGTNPQKEGMDRSAKSQGSSTDSFRDMEGYKVTGSPVNSYANNDSSGDGVDWVDYASSDPDLLMGKGGSGATLAADPTEEPRGGRKLDASGAEISIDSSANSESDANLSIDDSAHMEDSHQLGGSGTEMSIDSSGGESSSSSSASSSNSSPGSSSSASKNDENNNLDLDVDDDDIEWEDFDGEINTPPNEGLGIIQDRRESYGVDAENEMEKQERWQTYMNQQEYDSDSYSENVEWEDA